LLRDSAVLRLCVLIVETYWRNNSPVVCAMKNSCLRYGCIKCCLNTKMPLRTSDIEEIRGLGFTEDFFVTRRDGELRLRNLNGRCVFHNGERCTIYNDRPEGCRLYPAVFDEDKGRVVLHAYCPHRKKFQLTPTILCEVVKLVRKLDAERKRRL